MSERRKTKKANTNNNANASSTPVKEKQGFFFKPQTEGQKDYVAAIADNVVTFATGPAGTGKSFCAIALACSYLQEGRYDNIVIARPTVEASKKGLGFIPGDINEKLSPYLMPAIKHMKKIFTPHDYAVRVNAGQIQFESLEYMRGSTYDYSFMILEEAQNCTFEQLEMFITRIGTNSKIVINGDVGQSDLVAEGAYTDLDRMMDRVENLKNFGIVELTKADIVRNPIIADFLKALGK